MKALAAIVTLALGMSTMAPAQTPPSHQHHQRGATPAVAPPSDATQAYLAAMDKMHGPMMEGARASNPDVAFVRGMIPHHQGAIDMARIVLQYGKDAQ